MAGRLGRLKRLPTFTVTSRGEFHFGLRSLDPMFRFSLTRLVEAVSPSVPGTPESSSPGAEARFAAGWDSHFRQEWLHLRAAVYEAFHNSNQQKRSGYVAPLFVRGQLTALHNDIRVLLRSQAGAFIFEYYQNTLLPAAACLMLEQVERRNDDLIGSLSAAWTHFYCHVLPALEAIFVQVKMTWMLLCGRKVVNTSNTTMLMTSRTALPICMTVESNLNSQKKVIANQKSSIRQVTLLAFRDCVVLKLATRLESLLEEMYTEGSIPPAIKQMFLVLQSVVECYPPSEKRLRLESLVARTVSAYLGHRGLYEDGNHVPVLRSRELDVAHLRRPSLVDPRRLSRPLSVNTSLPRMETLSDLFALSADRVFHRRVGSRDNM